MHSRPGTSQSGIHSFDWNLLTLHSIDRKQVNQDYTPLTGTINYTLHGLESSQSGIQSIEFLVLGF